MVVGYVKKDHNRTKNGNRSLIMPAAKRRDKPNTHREFAVRDVVAAYDHSANKLAREYERHTFESVHAVVLDLVPQSNACILDVGAGSGRDAAWFATRTGNTVFAVEPSTKLRAAGRQRHARSNLIWMDDSLPGLDKVLRSKLTFDLIWLSGVWMHIPPSSRTRAFRKLVSILRPGGNIMISIRLGPPPSDRPMASTTAAEVEQLARHYGLQTVLRRRSLDVSGRTDVSWEVLWLRLPDDGSGALPLLRHVVFRDQKSSTYKLALLRALIRIADGASGFAHLSKHNDLNNAA